MSGGSSLTHMLQLLPGRDLSATPCEVRQPASTVSKHISADNRCCIHPAPVTSFCQDRNTPRLHSALSQHQHPRQGCHPDSTVSKHISALGCCCRCPEVAVSCCVWWGPAACCCILGTMTWLALLVCCCMRAAPSACCCVCGSALYLAPACCRRCCCCCCCCGSLLAPALFPYSILTVDAHMTNRITAIQYPVLKSVNMLSSDALASALWHPPSHASLITVITLFTTIH